MPELLRRIVGYLVAFIFNSKLNCNTVFIRRSYLDKVVWIQEEINKQSFNHPQPLLEPLR